MVRSYCCRARAVAKTAPRPVEAPVTTARRRLVSCTVAVCAMSTPPQAFSKTPLLPCMRRSVAYSNEAQVQSLGVDPGVFERSGAVSVETACAMAEGLHRLSQADMVLAETGIAGPIRGRSPKPLGSTCFAMRTPTGMHTEEVQFSGDRHVIQEQIAEHALGMIAQYLTT